MQREDEESIHPHAIAIYRSLRSRSEKLRINFLINSWNRFKYQASRLPKSAFNYKICSSAVLYILIHQRESKSRKLITGGKLQMDLGIKQYLPIHDSTWLRASHRQKIQQTRRQQETALIHYLLDTDPGKKSRRHQKIFPRNCWWRLVAHRRSILRGK